MLLKQGTTRKPPQYPRPGATSFVRACGGMCTHILVGARRVAVDVDGVCDHCLRTILAVLVADPVPAFKNQPINTAIKEPCATSSIEAPQGAGQRVESPRDILSMHTV